MGNEELILRELKTQSQEIHAIKKIMIGETGNNGMLSRVKGCEDQVFSTQNELTDHKKNHDKALDEHKANHWKFAGLVISGGVLLFTVISLLMN